MKKKLQILSLLLLSIFITSCNLKEDTTEGELNDISFNETEEVTNYVKIEMTSGDLMLIELYPDIAPITVENFQKLVKEKFYDGLIFHRVIKNFMIQGGDPNGDGTGGSEETIKGEFRRNGIDNNLKHTRGVISMGRLSNNMDSASSQFFIVHKDYPSLNGEYAAFGCMIAGYDTLDKIANVSTDEYDKPLQEQKIKTIRFITVEGLEKE